MTAIGRALMARPKMILLDEPSMGLAPQLVEEIFEIVRDLNAKERVSFLLAEQNTMVALRYADYGYILENGRVVMDGAAEDLRTTRTSRSSISACRRRGARPSRTSSTTAGASAGWHESHGRLLARSFTIQRSARTPLAPARPLLGVAGARLHKREHGRARPRSEVREREDCRQIAHAKARCFATSRRVDRDQTRDALARLPLTRKRDLIELQKAPRRSAGSPRATAQARAYSPRPARSTRRRATELDPWRMARVLYAAGFRNGDLIHNCFSYHFTPAGSFSRAARSKLGCSVFPGGTGQTEQQVQAIADLRPEGYVGTPSFLRIIVEKAEELGVACTSRKACVSGEALPGVTRDGCARAASPATSATRTADIGADRLRDRGARRASSSTRKCSSRSFAPAPAIRWRPARWARWSSPPSIPITR